MLESEKHLSLVIDGCQFDRNTATNVGIVWTYQFNLRIMNSKFSRQYGKQEIGLVYAIKSTVDVSNSTFEHNYAKYQFSLADSRFIVTNCSFAMMSVQTEGG